MKTWRYIAAAVFLWVGFLGVVAGCGFWLEGQKEESTDTVTRLRVIYSSGDIRWMSCMEWIAEEFMKEYPQVQVTLMAPADVAGQSFTDRLKALIAQNEFYDVVELREAARFSDAGYLAPLPQRLTSLIAREDPKEPCYALPRYTTTQGIIYNRDLFERLGLSLPETYEDFLEICAIIREQGISPVAIGGADIWHMGFWGNYLYQNYLLDEHNESCWSRERIITMLTDFRSLNQKGYIEDRFCSISDSQTVQELSSGNAAMLYSGPWIMDQVTSLNPQMNLGFFYLPDKNGKVRAMVDDSVSWGISMVCMENKERFKAAVDFLEFFYAEGIYEYVLAQMNGESVTVRSVQDGKTSTQQEVKKAGEKDVIFCSRLIGDEETPDGFRSFYDLCLQDVLWGNTELEKIAEELEKRWGQ